MPVVSAQSLHSSKVRCGRTPRGFATQTRRLWSCLLYCSRRLAGALSGRIGKGECDHRAPADRAFGPHAASMRFHDRLYEAEAQTKAAFGSAAVAAKEP